MKMHTRETAWLGLVLGLALTARAVPPPPPGGGGSIKPPDTAPPGKIYFEENVVIVGPGFVPPDADAGTVFIDLTKTTPDPVNPVVPDTTRTVRQVVNELNQVKTQIESETGAMPRGLFNPATLLAVLGEADLTAGRGVFDDPAFLHEEVGGGEAAAADRTEQARSGGAAVKTAPGTPAPAPVVRGRAGDPVTPSYWQLPIR